MNFSYHLRCLYCNGALYPVVLDAASAPWICVICRHGWWVAELEPTATPYFRPAYCDFGFQAPSRQIQAAALAERETAWLRGSSCREDQLPLVPLAGLRWLAASGLESVFAALVAAELARKEG